MSWCTVCGAAAAGPDSHFCSACGAELTKPTLEGYCPTCHQVRAAEEGDICSSCHAELVDVHTAPLVSSGATRATEVPRAMDHIPPPLVAAQPYGAQPYAAQPYPLPPRPTSHRRRFVALAATAVATVALVALGVSRFGGDDEAADRPATTASIATLPDGSTDDDPPATSSNGGVPGTPVTASGGGGGITVVSSNAYMEQGGMSIDGEDRTLYFVAELRNDSGAMLEIDELTITVSDASGAVIATRHDSPIDSILVAGEVAYVYEFTPSMMYRSDETNNYPDGWASWDLAVTAEPYEPSDYEEVNLEIQGLSVTPSGSPVRATGTIVNSTDRVVSATTIEVYVALYDASGALVNVGWTFADSAATDTLAPGGSTTFTVDVPFGPAEYASTVVGAVGMTEP